MGKCLGFYTLRRGVFCVNCASFFSFDTMHKIDSKKRQKVLTMDKFQYFFLRFWNDKFLYFIPLLPAKNLYNKKQQQKNLWDTLMLFQFHELFSVIFWHKFCSLCMYHYDTRMAPTKELIAISIKEVDTHNQLFRSIEDAISILFYHLVRLKSHRVLGSEKSPNIFWNFSSNGMCIK